MTRRLLTSAMLLAVLGWCSSASAAPIVFTTSGDNGVSAKATFDFGTDSFTVTLENLTNPIGFTSQELDGLRFRLSPGGSATLTSVAAAGIVDCTSDHTYPCAPYAGVVPANDGWGASTSAGLTMLTTTPLGFHPYAIINTNYELPAAGNGNLANGQHNPFLLGPVLFTFAGTFTDVSDVSFYWGTQPYVTSGTREPDVREDPVTVPEPSSIFLLGTGLAWVGRRAWRRSTATA